MLRFVLVALLLVAVATEAGAQLTPGDFTRSLSADGTLREYDVHVPAGYDGSTAVPLIIDFHGFNSNEDLQKGWSGWNILSETEGFIVLHPKGLFASWNAGTCCGSAVSQNIDDVAFARAMILATAAEASIDLRRVYPTGWSNGGALSHRLACEAAEMIAAAAPVAFPLALSPMSSCQPSRPISVIHFAGTDDRIVPFLGGGFFNAPPTPDSFAYWRDTNGCGSGLPDETVVIGASMCETYTNCSTGVEVGLCSVDADDGLPFPGHLTYNNADLVVAEVAWEFLAPFQAPAPVCGDSLIGAGESCDDGNTDPGDGCSATCQTEPPIPVPVMSPIGVALLAAFLVLAGTYYRLTRRHLPERACPRG